ncbi:hypothetical protein SanaruYs_18570 [Chryseotalea sanaruensis]|uniref:Class I SAM-dependent methyltransferase n=2 Tax=Chryseotalea sanaruensis TaxID=2482724 RepID=A0A401U9S3_9BACT|nr:hypothetical protein SanaruYs_18570 [Chryseotalea sanaruensis]
MFTIAKEMYAKIKIYKWKSNGALLPPPHIVKQMTIREYQNRYHYNILVETGTYSGEMVEAQKKRFKRIFSIELGVDLYKKATTRFKNDKNVTILLGDSGKELTKVLLKITEPAIFWLDGHYSSGTTAKGEKECPIVEELAAIFSSKKFNHILLIDDARCFSGEGDYPTIDQLTNYIKSKNANYRVEVKDDIVRYVI